MKVPMKKGLDRHRAAQRGRHAPRQRAEYGREAERIEGHEEGDEGPDRGVGVKGDVHVGRLACG